MADEHLTRRASKGPTGAGTAVAGRAAARHVDYTEHLVLTVPYLGTVRLPAPPQLAYYGGVAALLALEIIDWPLALLVAAGHALTQQHSQALEEFGEALEQARD